ncbi:MAG: ribonucleoside reductase class II, partial [Candidatus Infernicultor aquiphilus]
MISENALEILNKRYFLKDKNGKVIEDWDKLCRRVAKVVSQDEPKEHQKKWEDKYYDLMYNLKFLPNSPTLMNAGANIEGLSACYVIPIEDSMENIMNAVKYSALVHKSGGGTGFSFSKLRPVNSVVKSTSGVASGPVSFMRMINAVTEEIKQGGKRRGANLGSISCSHPDIEEFIDCKKDTSKITNFNISVEITDVFMNAVENDTEYDIIDPRTKQIVKKIKARSIFDKIVHNAWETGEPGLLFIDTINKKNLYGTIETTNPCITGDTYILTIDGPISIKELESVMNNSKNMLNKIDIYCW